MAREPYQYESERYAALSKPSDGPAPARSGRMLRAALLWVILACGIAAGASGFIRWKAASLSGPARPTQSSPLPSHPAAKPAAARVQAPNSQIYRADPNGHFLVDARVNGAPIRFLVDTGATVVALTQEDARAAGVLNGMLSYSLAVQTADGVAHAAPVTLREIALGQMTQEEVPAIVMEKSAALSLLGMSFLRRLNYEVHDQQLILYW
jgi:aspartyl protease family protein